MCGISGFFEKNNGAIKDKSTVLRSLTDSITHRGPDDLAEYIDGPIGFGMRRLAILDLQKDLYPFFSDDKQISMIFNGEIYNFQEIKDELTKLGHSFKTTCDAEVIVKGYEQWGLEIIKKLRGMFAIILWDGHKQKLYLIRDRLGIKPIYYLNQKDALFFSSEVKSFYALGNEQFTPQLNMENLELLLGFMFLPKSNETIINGVQKVPPASYLEISTDEFKVVKYWNLSDIEVVDEKDFAVAESELEQLLNESVQMHLMSDVPLGIMLSGGLDSSLLTALIAKNKDSKNTVNTFTAKFNHKFNESDYAKQVATEFNTNHTEVFIDTDKLSQNIEDYVYLLDDLTTFDGGIFTTKLLCDEIRKYGIKVLLLGEGSDEIFGGYSWFGLSQLPFSLLPKQITNALNYYAISRNVSYKLPNNLKHWNNISNNSNRFNNIAEREILTQLPNHLLMKVDKGSMGASIEARVPFLDHKLVEYVHSLPAHFKLGGKVYNKQATEKFILRKIAAKYLPQSIYTRKKRGFMLPMNDVLNSNISKVKDYVFKTNSIASNMFSRNELQKLFDHSNYSVVNMSREYMLWRLFLLEVWADHYSINV